MYKLGAEFMFWSDQMHDGQLHESLIHEIEGIVGAWKANLLGFDS